MKPGSVVDKPCIEKAKVRHVPWVADVLVILGVLQPIGTTSDDFGDYIGPFPLGC